MKTGLVAVVLVGMLGSGAAMAADAGFDGNELLMQCQYYIKLVDGGTVKTNAHFSAGACGGFVHGVLATTLFYSDELKKDEKFCVPNNATYAQLVRVVVKYLTDNPKRLNETQMVLTWAALRDAYPCK